MASNEKKYVYSSFGWRMFFNVSHVVWVYKNFDWWNRSSYYILIFTLLMSSMTAGCYFIGAFLLFAQLFRRGLTCIEKWSNMQFLEAAWSLPLKREYVQTEFANARVLWSVGWMSHWVLWRRGWCCPGFIQSGMSSVAVVAKSWAGNTYCHPLP